MKISNSRFFREHRKTNSRYGAVTAVGKMGRITAQIRIIINGSTDGFGIILLKLLNQQGSHINAVTSKKGVEYAKK